MDEGEGGEKMSTVSRVFLSILVAHAVLLAWISCHDSPTTLEPDQLVAGLSHWQIGTFDLMRVNPPLVRMIASVPVLCFSPKADWHNFDASIGARSERYIRQDFAFANSRHFLWFHIISRWACIPFSLLGAFMCYRWTKDLYGERAGILATTLWCASPAILAYGPLITPDCGAAAMGVAATYGFWLWLKTPSWKSTLVAGLGLGLAESTKTIWIVLFALWPVCWVAYRASARRKEGSLSAEQHSVAMKAVGRESLQFAVILLLGIYILNMGYGFEGSMQKLGDYKFVSDLLGGPRKDMSAPLDIRNRFSGTALASLPVPLPKNCVMGIDLQRLDFEHGLPSYLRGEWADHGWWYYYLYALAIKMPLGTWLLAALAVGMTVWEVCGRKRSGVRGQRSGTGAPSPLARRPTNLRSVPEEGGKGTVPVSSDETWDSRRASWRDEMVVLAPFFTILIFVSSQTGFSVHSRYVIPALPFLFVWISKVGRALEKHPHPLPLSQRERGIRSWLHSRRQPVLAVLVIFALAWSVGSSLSIYPHSLSYFNELAAILPTPADASYPKPDGDSPIFRGGKSGQSPIMSVLSAFKWAISAGPRNGPRHLLDSNIDWSQDLLYLKEWLDRNGTVKLDGLVYHGCYAATLIGIPETPYPPAGSRTTLGRPRFSEEQSGPKQGWYALSVDKLYARGNQYRYFLNFEPVAMAGYAIYIYHITLDEANRVRRKLGLPELKAERQRS